MTKKAQAVNPFAPSSLPENKTETAVKYAKRVIYA